METIIDIDVIALLNEIEKLLNCRGVKIKTDFDVKLSDNKVSNIFDFSEHDAKIRKEMEYEIYRLTEENTRMEKKIKSLEEGNSKYASANSMYIDNLERCESSNERLNKKIQEMQAEVQRLREKCGEVPLDTEKSRTYDVSPDYKKICCELQDHHQQDCIRYNDMRTAFLKTVDELAMLRKQLGVGQ